MSTELFPVCTEPPPKMFGRQATLDRLVRELTKPTPGHHSIVAPRYMGKTVFLHALAERLRQNAGFTAVIEWDLKHGTPQTDEDFRKQLCVKIGLALQSTDFADLGKELAEATSEYHELLGMVLDVLPDSDASILMLWDGFDRPLTLGKLTRNLWDNLRELARRPSLRLVTSSRKEISELIRDEQSVTSDFWNIFQQTRLPPLKESEIEDMLQMLPGCTVEKGAGKELMNWSGGNPLALCHMLNEVPHESILSSASVNAAALASAEVFEGYLLDIWKDLDVPSQDAFRFLQKSGSRLTGEINKSSRRELLASGLALDEGNKIFPTFRLMAEMLKGREDESDAVFRLFHTWESYSENISEVLKRRLSHLSRFHEILFRLVTGSIDSLREYPPMALSHLTDIRDTALKYIFDREFGSESELPGDLISYWSDIQIGLPNHRRDRLLQSMIEADEKGLDSAWKIPEAPGQKIHLLRLLVGADASITQNKSKFLTKEVYALLEHIHGFRNMKEHMQGDMIGLGTAVTALMTCVELLACLDSDTSKILEK